MIRMTIEELQEGIEGLGFERAYVLFVPDLDEVQEGVAYTRGELTLCLRGKQCAIRNRWTGELLLNRTIHKELLTEIKNQLN